ncbi:hypothetical protein AVEN_162435-1 [Araneus ventricosus]|uniref:Uncharacterized protein n=1 Tax=Araneus ventricosus TaxID=182803 RepID=A0A4Y2NQ94_ARAVE|nr:hypothetical protein AVEN_162435-1 [Araneus ventricosus]
MALRSIWCGFFSDFGAPTSVGYPSATPFSPDRYNSHRFLALTTGFGVEQSNFALSGAVLNSQPKNSMGMRPAALQYAVEHRPLVVAGHAFGHSFLCKTCSSCSSFLISDLLGSPAYNNKKNTQEQKAKQRKNRE